MMTFLAEVTFIPFWHEASQTGHVNRDIESSAHEQYVTRCPVAGFVRRRLA